jgi:hypothetical protein
MRRAGRSRSNARGSGLTCAMPRSTAGPQVRLTCGEVAFVAYAAASRWLVPPGHGPAQPSAGPGCGSSSAAAAKARNAAITGSCWLGGSAPSSRASSARRLLVTSATSSRPAAVSVIRTERRSPACRCRRTRPLPTSRSHMRVAVDGFTASAAASTSVLAICLGGKTDRYRRPVRHGQPLQPRHRADSPRHRRPERRSRPLRRRPTPGS